MWTNISDVMTLKLSILVKYIVMISVIIRKVKNFKKSVVFFPPANVVLCKKVVLCNCVDIYNNISYSQIYTTVYTIKI